MYWRAIVIGAVCWTGYVLGAPPVAVDDAGTVPTGSLIGIRVLDNDSDPEGPEDLDPDSFALVQAPAFGTVTYTNRTARYTHNGIGGVTDFFRYTVRDIGGAPSNIARVDLVITPDVRYTNSTLRLPPEVPPTSVQTEDAFPGVSFSSPVALTSPPGETNRLFVVEKNGRVAVIPDLSSPSREVFLDLSGVVSTSGEQGLLGLAFHPDYASNGYFFVFYTMIDGGSVRRDRLSRFQVSADPNRADAGSELVLINQRDQQSNHNGGDLHFGPDNYLYISLGDEGGGDDSLSNSQKIDQDFFSGILRLDVDRDTQVRPFLEPNPHLDGAIVTNFTGTANYGVPPDNPWVGATTLNGDPINTATLRSEFWVIGLRNPWRMSFDAQTDELYIGDVGQGAREEIDVATGGENFGWQFREGFIATSRPNPNNLSFDDPIWDYPRTEGRSVIGGVVYRGTRIPELHGAYVFGDYESKNVWALRRTDGVTVELLLNAVRMTCFGIDPANGDVLLSNYFGSQILRLVPGPGPAPGSDFPPTLSETGAFADTAGMTANPGWVAYEPSVAFWSDYAEKSRWFTVPNPAKLFTYAEDTNWEFPSGTVWMKHFDLEMDRGNPASRTRVETRFLVRVANGVYGISYRWREDQQDADLVSASGTNILFQVMDGGQPTNQLWRIPGRSQCLECHTQVGGHALSFNTRQLNQHHLIFGSNQNQLTGLSNAGYLDATIPDPSTLPTLAPADDISQSLEFRARSYLAVNCISCHQPGGGTPTAFDVRPGITLAQTGLIDGIPLNNGGNPAARLIAAGSPTNSVLLSRISACCGFTRMPPLGSNEIDHQSVQLITDWINSLGNLTYDAFAALHGITGGQNDDDDGDGWSNLAEFLSNTIPVNPASKISLADIAGLGGDQVSVRWNSPQDGGAGSRSYDLYHSDGPYSAASSWTQLAGPLPQQGALTAYSDAVGGVSDLRFYSVMPAGYTGGPAESLLGVRRLVLREGMQNFVAFPFDIADASLAALFPGSGLPAGPTEAIGSVIDLWDEDGQSFSARYFLSNAPGFEGWRVPGTFADANAVTVDPDQGVVLTLRAGVGDRNFYLAGPVPQQAATAYTVKPNYNLVSARFPSQVTLAESGLLAAGFQGNARFFLSDLVIFTDPGSNRWESLHYYNTAISQWIDLGEGSVSTAAFEPGRAFLILKRGGGNLNWNLTRPYPVPLQGP